MKRRRLDDASSSLSKPFKSPLINRKGNTRSADVESSSLSPSLGPSENSKTTTPPRPVPIRQSPRSSPLGQPLSKRTPQVLHDPEVVALQKRHSALSLQFSKLKQKLDTSQQALKVVQSDQDQELETLVERWRATSREAAEEVFRGAKDKINRMGGVGAWRERTNRKPRGWEDDDEPDLMDLTAEQRADLEYQKQEMADEAEKYGLTTEKEPEGNDDDTFTMEMMLKSMNIDLRVIGYNAETQRWVD